MTETGVSDAVDGPVLITGATGFVGSHVVRAFVRAGIPIRALVRGTSDTVLLDAAGAALVEGSLTDDASLVRAVDGASGVVHLAGLTGATSEAEYHRVNALATGSLVHAARGTGIATRRFVYLSSLAAVGPTVAGRPAQPDDTPRPLSAYGRSKLEGERAVLAGEGVSPIILRAPAVYGPNDRELLRFFRVARRGFLPLPAGPERALQLIHAEDLAEALLLAVRSDATGIVHAADPSAYTWREVAGLVAAAVGRQARIVPVPAALVSLAGGASEALARIRGGSTVFNREKARELLAPGWLCETDSARAKLGFVARTPLARGLVDTALWYRENGWL
jgi:nucleoside-diphosphate-sugar epimerase